MTKDEFKEYLCEQIDLMDDGELEEFSVFLENREEDEKIAEELIMIRGEFKKLTKLVHTMEDKMDENRKLQTKEELKPLIAFDKFLKNSKDAVDSLPKVSFWGRKKLQRSIDALQSGFESAEKGYDDVLQGVGLMRTAKVGESFNPDLHEAVETTENRDMAEGVIVEVLEEGYLYRDEVVNYAKVKVNRWIS